MVRGLCTSRFTAVPVGLYGMCCGRVSEQKMDNDKISTGSYSYTFFPWQFRHTPTHRGSLAELAKSLASLREWITFSICPSAEAPCVKRRVVERVPMRSTLGPL